MDRLATLWHGPGGTGFIFALLALISLGFLLRFVLPALILLRQLGQAVGRLEKLVQTQAAAKSSVAPQMIAREIMQTPRLAHLWREYAQTLHSLGGGAVQTQAGPTVWRATTMAESYFTEAALVETPLKTEFYKHLPGILTGIGIIGTFAGLIVGLTHFEVNSDADTVRLSLKTLIQGVGHAFQVSALAIALAMLATWIEKSLVTLACRKVARLCELIDSLFEGGVEEEYLARLVQASELSVSQGSQLRQALVLELRQSLGALAQQQNEQLAKQQEQMAAALAHAVSQAVGQAVGQALREPLARMASAVEKAGSSQGEATARTLEPLLGAFVARMEANLGQGQSGLEALLARTAESLSKVVGELGRVAARLDGAGQGAVSSAAGQLQNAGAGVGRAADTFAQASTQLLAATSALAGAATEAGNVMREQGRTRDAFAVMLNDLKVTTENARREAALTGELVSRLEAAGSALAGAKIEARDYLDGVTRVLAEAHASFAENIERTLRQGNSQFHKELSTAVDYLKGAIEELGDTLENLAVRK
ncbi:anti-phage ZorAB system protein ZorA [Azonexus sp.]|uniref:anti-phage ZorAB system protein ZorA n=1 Tax=Azonexus sp. TaxID=1872668 RepID=UPI0039E619DA